jgi:hypothetical protein
MDGSDEMMWQQSIKISVEDVRSASFLTESQNEDIFYNNAAPFLQFSEACVISTSLRMYISNLEIGN